MPGDRSLTAKCWFPASGTPRTQSVLFSGAEKRTKRDIHLPQAPPYMEGM